MRTRGTYRICKALFGVGSGTRKHRWREAVAETANTQRADESLLHFIHLKPRCLLDERGFALQRPLVIHSLSDSLQLQSSSSAQCVLQTRAAAT